MRVIAGTAKGVPLVAPRGEVRPTTDRVREAVFSVFADLSGSGGRPAEQQLAGLSLLDLYAGSGAVAVEAASRGAAPVVAVDQAGAACQAISRNAAAATVAVNPVRARVEAYLGQRPSQFDIVWLDPPYALAPQALAEVLAQVGEHWLAAGAIVAVERSARSRPPTWPPGLAQPQQRRYGETVVYFGSEQL